MGKYNGLKHTLPKFELEPDFRAKVEEAKSSYIGLEAPDLAREFKLQRNGKQLLEANVKNINVHLEALSQLLVENLEGAEIQKIKLASGETVYLSDEPYTCIVDRGVLMDWLRRKKLTQLFTVQWQTLNAMTKDMLIQGKPTPPGTTVYMKTSARLRGGNSQEEQ